MGRDKTSSKPVPKVEPQKVEDPKKKARGHRQKGAGTVIVAKAPIETSDGIILKTHERLPFTLLREFCQKEKRPLPNYARKRADSDSMWRFGVTLPDKKQSKDDLWFLPVQSFPSDKMAKDYAALLALFHFQSSLPLERKMPQPYADTWRSMCVNKNKPGAAGASASASASARAGAFAGTVAASSIRDAVGNEGKEGSAPLKSGGGGISLSRAASSSSSFSSSSSSSSHVTAGTAFASTKNRLEAVVDLRATNKFASKSEGTKVGQEARALRSRKNAYFDALRRANRPMPVQLSARMRRILEHALHLEPTATEAVDVQADEKDFTSQLAVLASDISADQEVAAFVEPTVLPCSTQADAVRSVAAGLKDAKFPGLAVVAALSFLYDEAADEVGMAVQKCKVESPVEALEKVLRERALQRLCLILPETAIPAGFDASGAETKSSIQVVRGKAVSSPVPPQDGGGGGGASQDSTMGGVGDAGSGKASIPGEQAQRHSRSSPEALQWSTHFAGNISKAAVRIAKECAGYGFTPEECACAVGMGTASDSMSDMERVHRALLLLLAATSATAETTQAEATCALMEGGNGNGTVAANSWWTLDQVQEEAEVLKSIFPETLSTREDPDARAMSLCVALDPERVAWPKAWRVQGAANFRLDVRHSFEAVSGVEGVDQAQLPLPLPLPRLPLLHVSGPVPAGVTRTKLLAVQVHLVARSSSSSSGGDDDDVDCFTLLSALEEGAIHRAASESPHADNDIINILYQWSQGLRTPGRTTPAALSGSGSEPASTSTSVPSAPPTPVPVSLPAAAFDEAAAKKAAVKGSVNSTSNKKAARKTTRTRHRGDNFWSSPAVVSTQVPRPDGTISAVRARLPAAHSRAKFVALVGEGHVVVTGETGCGKTTQIPQFITETDPHAKIVVCQPRRLAAVGVAARVAEEVGCALGDTVGYMVRGDSKVSQATRILFCTYGVLLRRLQEDPDLGAITHVVLDEVHERGMESDFAMALLTQSARRRAGLNIVLMSATIATDRFATYLGAATGLEGKAPVLEIPGRTFPVADFYKNSYEERVLELAHLRAYRDDDDVGYGDHSARRGGGSGAPASDRIDYQLAAALLGVLTDGTGADDSAVGAMLEPAQGAILVFLPGVPEIDRMARVLSSSTVGRRRTAVFPLHGALSPADQKQVFAPLSRDKSGSAPLKIVLSTNVAEASVTIPDVTVVVDTCRVKESGFDAERGMTSLLTKFCAKDSMRQRMGRAGRVSAGRCFRLITSGTYEKLPAHGLPEMKRVPLDRLVLQCSQMLHVRRQQRAATGQVVKAQKDAIVPPLERCFRMLRACPDPPEKAAVEGAHQSLMECRALQQDGTITPLGQHLAALPCTPRLGRILIYGALLGCAAPCAAVAAALITRSPFLSQRDPADRKRADQARARLAGTNGRQTQNSDHLVLAAAVSAYRAVSSHGAKRLFCRDHCLSAERMAEVCQQQEDLLDGLVQLGFVANRRAALAHSRDGPGAARLLAGAICAGLYPQLVRIIKPPKRFIATHSGAVEREAEGKEIKYFLTDKDALPHAEPTDPKEREYAARDANIDTKGMRRIFVHPSSVNFHAGSYQSFYLVYGELTGDANRTYVRDCTEVSAFPLLLFGGALATNYSEGTVTVDNNVRFQAPGRIVALVEKLRAALDVLLEDKIADPFLDVESSVERAAAVEVITCDGI